MLFTLFSFYFVLKQFDHMLTLDSVNVLPSVDVYKSRKKQELTVFAAYVCLVKFRQLSNPTHVLKRKHLKIILLSP